MKFLLKVNPKGMAVAFSIQHYAINKPPKPSGMKFSETIFYGMLIDVPIILVS